MNLGTRNKFYGTISSCLGNGFFPSSQFCVRLFTISGTVFFSVCVSPKRVRAASEAFLSVVVRAASKALLSVVV